MKGCILEANHSAIEIDKFSSLLRRALEELNSPRLLVECDFWPCGQRVFESFMTSDINRI